MERRRFIFHYICFKNSSMFLNLVRAKFAHNVGIKIVLGFKKMARNSIAGDNGDVAIKFIYITVCSSVWFANLCGLIT